MTLSPRGSEENTGRYLINSVGESKISFSSELELCRNQLCSEEGGERGQAEVHYW